MSSTTLRYPSAPLRVLPGKKPVPRGASRLEVKTPRNINDLMRPLLARLKRLVWPVVLVLLVMGSFELSDRLIPMLDRPIGKVSVLGDLTQSNQQMIQQFVQPYAATSFFTIDLPTLRAELEQLPWVSRAEVRRVWPDKLLVRIDEQLPVARWGDSALLNNRGQAFTPGELTSFQHLPLLIGPARAQEQIMQQYQMFSQMLRPLGLSITRLELHERGSWFLSTAEGIEILLGADHLLEKMNRFTVIYTKELKAQVENIVSVDLRYPNGLAVAWRVAPEPEGSASAAKVH